MIGEDDLKNVLDELENISDIHSLGLNLGIRMAALKEICQLWPPSQQKMEVIFSWLTRKDIIKEKLGEVPTWNFLADAVERESRVMAQKIRSKEGKNPE